MVADLDSVLNCAVQTLCVFFVLVCVVLFFVVVCLVSFLTI